MSGPSKKVLAQKPRFVGASGIARIRKNEQHPGARSARTRLTKRTATQRIKARAR